MAHSARSQILRRGLAAVFVGVLSISLTALGTAFVLLRSLPQVSGTLAVEGLTAPVAVYRDAWGVPHIEAATLRDLYFAQGFVTAQDRLWQMDLARRAAAGRLSEVVGPSLVDMDKLFRTLLLRRTAVASLEACSDQARLVLEAYAAGVNACIGQASARGLPLEFRLLRYKPEPWTAVDSLSIGTLMAYELSGNWLAEAYRHQLRWQVGDELAAELDPAYPDGGITIMRYQGPGDGRVEAGPAPPAARLDLSGLLAAVPPAPSELGSNNWVVDGTRTASGAPMLANDPHVLMCTPPFWHEAHLVVPGAEGLNVAGVTLPGVPGILVGRNERIAWGVTNGRPDVQDLYIERRNPDDPYAFEFRGAWEQATVYRESIPVRGRAPVAHEVVVTRHGPIISELAGTPGHHPGEALALCWTATPGTAELDVMLAVARAADWTEFRQALRGFEVPAQNFVFACVDGTIAYRLAGSVPVRPGNGLLPVPGWSGEHEWQGRIPFEEMPESVAPDCGFIASANNRVVDDGYPHRLGLSWSQPYRAARIAAVLGAAQQLTADDMRRLQVDYLNLHAGTVLPVLLAAVEGAELGTQELQALRLLQQWDLVDGVEQGAPLIFHYWWRRLNRLLYEPFMGPDLFSQMADQGNITDAILLGAGHGQENGWLRAAGGLERLATDSFKAAVAELVSTRGRYPACWRWGDYHRLGPPHPIGAAVRSLFGFLLNPREYPVGGGTTTVGAMLFATDGRVYGAAPWRQVVDLSDPVGRAWAVLTPGQSGHPFSRWYQDQARAHVGGELFERSMAPGDYRQGKKLVLSPASP